MLQVCNAFASARTQFLSLAMSGSPPAFCNFLMLCVSSLIIMPVKYMREIMENFQAFCNQTSLHGWQYITQRPETDGFWAGGETSDICFSQTIME